MQVAFAAKLNGATSVARALDRGDVAHAQVAALLLRLPDPPALTKGKPNGRELADLAARLEESGLLRDGDASSRPAMRAALRLTNESEPRPVGKFNPYHDERGRFTTADATVEQTEENDTTAQSVDPVAEERHRQEAPSSERSNVRSTEDVGRGTRPISLAAFAPLPCSDAFRACAQIAAFQRPALIANCIAALRACKSTGLPTILAPGVVGFQ